MYLYKEAYEWFIYLLQMKYQYYKATNLTLYSSHYDLERDTIVNE